MKRLDRTSLLCALALTPFLASGSFAQDAPADPSSNAPVVTGEGATPTAAADRSGSASSADPAVAAQNLPPMIEDVQVVGPWTSGSQSGVWRTVMLRSATQENVYHFFVQQLGEEGGTLTLKSSTEINEISTIDGAVVGYRADEPSPEEQNSLTLFFDVVPKDAEIAETYQLHFFDDAPYDFGPATN